MKVVSKWLTGVVVVVSIATFTSFVFGGTVSNTKLAPKAKPDKYVTDVSHTPVERQSIGNCWLYAQSGWLTSLLKNYEGIDYNISESYWTWWHWYDQLSYPYFSETEISTGGTWSTATRIINDHGWVKAEDFIPEEKDLEMSYRQKQALDYVNAQIKSGDLDSAEKRTPEKVRAVLDTAFNTSMAEAEAKSHSARSTIIKSNSKGTVYLSDTYSGSSSERWRLSYYPLSETGRKTLLKRVFKALNDKNPVLMSVKIDFNGQDITDNGSFKLSTLQQAIGPGSQGGHMVVLEDYMVENVPGYGTLGRGDMSDEMKMAAVEGDLVALVAKNSWGINRYTRGMKDGYTTFYKDYLLGPITWTEDKSEITPLQSFVIPGGY